MVLALLAAACATKLKPLPQNPPRIPDSPPDRHDSLDEAARLGLEAEKQRWGIEKDQELKRQAQENAEARQETTILIPMPAPNDSGLFQHADGGAPGR